MTTYYEALSKSRDISNDIGLGSSDSTSYPFFDKLLNFHNKAAEIQLSWNNHVTFDITKITEIKEALLARCVFSSQSRPDFLSIYDINFSSLRVHMAATGNNFHAVTARCTHGSSPLRTDYPQSTAIPALGAILQSNIGIGLLLRFRPRRTL